MIRAATSTIERSPNAAPKAPAPYTDLHKMPIAGVWRDGSSGRIGPNADPFNGDTLMTITYANAADVDEAYAAAKAAQRGWADLPIQERSTIIARAATILEQRVRQDP